MRNRKLFILLLVLIGTSLACSLTASQEPAPPPTPLPPSPVPPTIVPSPTIAVEKEISALMDTTGSGSVCPTGPMPVDSGDTPSYIGERGDSYTCEGFWTFDIQSIPSSVKVLSAIFLPGACTTSGAPFSYGDLAFELVDIGNLDVSDYGISGMGNFQNSGISVFWKNCTATSIDITDYVGLEVKKGATVIQVRAYMTSGNFSNGVDDYLSFRTGNIPTVMIRYK